MRNQNEPLLLSCPVFFSLSWCLLVRTRFSLSCDCSLIADSRHQRMTRRFLSYFVFLSIFILAIFSAHRMNANVIVDCIRISCSLQFFALEKMRQRCRLFEDNRSNQDNQSRFLSLSLFLSCSFRMLLCLWSFSVKAQPNESYSHHRCQNERRCLARQNTTSP